MDTHPLALWRAAQSPPASIVSVARALGASAPLVSEWERGTRRPGVTLALALEEHTAGAVPLETWGYDRDLFDLMRAAVERRGDA